MPAFSGYQPKMFQPRPMKPGPLPCIFSAVLPFTPEPGSAPTLTSQLGALSHASQLCAPEPAPSPSQIISLLPDATGAAGTAGPPAVALPALFGGAAPGALGQGGHRQFTVLAASTAMPAQPANQRRADVVACIVCIMDERLTWE